MDGWRNDEATGGEDSAVKLIITTMEIGDRVRRRDEGNKDVKGGVGALSYLYRD